MKNINIFWIINRKMLIYKKVYSMRAFYYRIKFNKSNNLKILLSLIIKVILRAVIIILKHN